MASINEIIQKIKVFWQTESEEKNRTVAIAVIFLVGTASFGIGRLSALDTPKEPVRIEMSENLVADVLQTGNIGQRGPEEKENPEDQFPEINLNKGGYVVASKNGGKYHLPWCSGAKRIKEENKVYFESIEVAKAAGLEPAGNCKGIE